MKSDMMSLRSPRSAYAIAAIVSAGVWFGTAWGTGKREAWDSAYYFIAGLPVLAGVVFGLGYGYPRSAWRLAVTVGGVQVASCIVWLRTVGSMLSFGVVLFALITGGLVLAGHAGAAVSHWRRRGHTG